MRTGNFLNLSRWTAQRRTLHDSHLGLCRFLVPRTACVATPSDRRTTLRVECPNAPHSPDTRTGRLRKHSSRGTWLNLLGGPVLMVETQRHPLDYGQRRPKHKSHRGAWSSPMHLVHKSPLRFQSFHATIRPRAARWSSRLAWWHVALHHPRMSESC